MGSTVSDKLRNFFAGIRYTAAKFLKAIKEVSHLSDRNWKWITYASVVLLAVYTLGQVLSLAGFLDFLSLFVLAILTLFFPLAIGGAIKAGLIAAGWIPKKASWLVFAAAALCYFYFRASFEGTLILVVYLLFTFLFIAGGFSNLQKTIWGKLSKAKKLLTIFFLSAGIANLALAVYFIVYPGPDAEIAENISLGADRLPAVPAIGDPALPGTTDYYEFTYGAGNDRHRTEFAARADVRSGSVDGRPYIDNWEKLGGRLRTAWWGFGPDSLPLNGRVHLPEGDGPFPVVLLVHGNHLDRDFSDTGYAYISRHLASRGYLSVSVDQNFLNSGIGDFQNGLKQENDARGWLLLKHLEFLRKENDRTGSPLHGKADTKNVVLVGHSRGGEAVCVAAAFNPLKYYPDNAAETFTFNFGIKGVVAIAPVDGQYLPSGAASTLSNVNLLIFQGGADADLDSYMGMQQYNRVRFTDSAYHFKAGLFISNANHGQFNRSWGKYDARYPVNFLLNRRALMSREEQERTTLVYVTAFLEATFRDNQPYKAVLRDYRAAREWIPLSNYVSQFSESSAWVLADFEEDIDLSTASSEKCTIEFSSFEKVFEERFDLKQGSSGTKALFLEWDNTPDSLPPAIYEIRLPGGSNALQGDMPPKNLQFDLALLEIDSTRGIDLSLRLADNQGDSAYVSLADYFPMNPPFFPSVYKLNLFYGKSESEIIPQHIEIPLSSFSKAELAFDPGAIRSLSFIFDKRNKGKIALDNIGFN